jgi:hypothetical protein
MADALVEYRGKVVRLKPGHSAVLKAYKKKMLGSVRVTVEPNEDGGIVPDGTLTITENGETDVSVWAKANVQVLPDEDVKITPTEETKVIKYDTEKKGIRQVTVDPIEVVEIAPVTENKRVTAPVGKYFKEMVVDVPANATVSGTLDIYENGVSDVTNFKNVNVQVLPDEGVNVVPTTEPQEINYNAEKKGIRKVSVAAIQTEGLAIKSDNVTFDEYAKKFSGAYVPTEGSFFNGVSLDLPLPNGYLKPENVERVLAKNNTRYDVTRDKEVTVSLPLDSIDVAPTEKEQTVNAREGFEALGEVKVAAIQIHTPEVVTSPDTTVTAPEGKYIKEVTVKVPTVKVFSGTAEPDASFGDDGDIYLKLEE